MNRKPSSSVHFPVREDAYWMEKALALARRGAGLTRPNPPVGAVIVQDGRLVASAWHRGAGKAHAEAGAIRKAGGSAKNAVLYTTLEPCCTFGKTPPCTEAIIESGIGRVVCGVRDPSPRHRGKGIRRLVSAGVKVTENVCSEEAVLLIEPFRIWIKQDRPYVSLKMGMSLDGKIADYKGKSRWITSGASRNRVGKLRSRVDAIIVGAETLRKDNPSLLPPASARNRPLRIVVSGDGRMPLGSRLFRDDHTARTVVAATKHCSKAVEKKYRSRGISVWRCAAKQNGEVSVRGLAKKMAKAGLLHVLCEGGGRLGSDLIRGGLVDEYLFFVAPVILGGSETPAVVSGRPWPLSAAPELRFTAVEKIGRDVFLRAIPGSTRKRKT
ncbi:MAG: bifunctional diaminohydroxyphosphoribosylaminopyrimidine deaminase/5-amino-6-(5-phosphoribosylamino)uracil reductase RibD [Kiritimatiellia bacterium]